MRLENSENIIMPQKVEEKDQSLIESNAQESYQHMGRIIREMKSKSPFQREKVSANREKIFSPENGEFFIDRITDSQTPEAEEICKFIDKFDPEEVDVDEIKINIQDDRYAYFVIQDGKKIVGCIQNSHIENLDNRDEVMIFIGHVIVAPEYWRKGLATELYQSVFERCLIKAQKENQIIKCIIGEGETKVEMENFFNQMNRKRIYFEDEAGNVHEVPYLQLPLKWDKETGRPINPWTGEVSSKEDIEKCSAHIHLMVRMIDDKQRFPAKNVLSLVKTLYEDNYAGKAIHGSPENPEVEKELDRLKEKLAKALFGAKDGEVFLMSAEERAKKIQELTAIGKKLYETPDN